MSETKKQPAPAKSSRGRKPKQTENVVTQNPDVVETPSKQESVESLPKTKPEKKNVKPVRKPRAPKNAKTESPVENNTDKVENNTDKVEENTDKVDSNVEEVENNTGQSDKPKVVNKPKNKRNNLVKKPKKEKVKKVPKQRKIKYNADGTIDLHRTFYIKDLDAEGNVIYYSRINGKKPKQAATKALTSIVKRKNIQPGNTISFTIVECTSGRRKKEYHYIGKKVLLPEPIKVLVRKEYNIDKKDKPDRDSEGNLIPVTTETENGKKYFVKKDKYKLEYVVKKKDVLNKETNKKEKVDVYFSKIMLDGKEEEVEVTLGFHKKLDPDVQRLYIIKSVQYKLDSFVEKDKSKKIEKVPKVKKVKTESTIEPSNDVQVSS